MEFSPDYSHFEAAMRNRRPARLPIYEHLVNVEFMEAVLGVRFAGLAAGAPRDVQEFLRQYCRFFREMTYDTVSFEVCIGDFMEGRSAICGGQGPIQSRADYEAFDWSGIPRRFWEHAHPRFEALAAVLPAGMKAVGGVGNGVFELAECFVGLEYLPFIQADDPELYSDLFERVGALMLDIWTTFLERHAAAFVACRFGDDLGFKSSLLTHPDTVRRHIIPQYRRVIDAVHRAGKPFLWHSCGCIFEVMEDAIAAGIDAKHSNEDAIAPFERWIALYGDRIGLCGGFDLGFLCQKSPGEIRSAVFDEGRRFRCAARGYALGSGNSIPGYVPVGNYLAMIEGAQRIRAEE